MSGRAGSAWRATIAVGVSLLAVLIVPATTSAADNADIRGSWQWVSLANGTQYPQTVTITTEDLSTGAVSGTDVGSGMTLTVTGTVSGTSMRLTISEPGYTADSTGTVSGSGDSRTWTGTFHDTNNTTGTYTATFVRSTPTPTPAAGGTSLDLRGSWDCVSHAGGADYPQTLHITSEDMASGAIGGTDVDTRNQTYTLEGTASGSTVAMTLSLASAGYVSHSQAVRVSGSGTALTMNGTFVDNNNTTGVFDCRLAAAAAAAGGAAATSSPTTPPSGAAGAAVTTGGGSGSGFWTIAGPGLGILVVAAAAAAVTVRRVQARRLLQARADQLEPPDLRPGDDGLSPRA